jgi:hypothetical protein
MSLVCHCGRKLGQSGPSPENFVVLNEAVADWAKVRVLPEPADDIGDGKVTVNVAAVLFELGPEVSVAHLCTNCRRVWVSLQPMTWAVYQPEDGGLEELVVTKAEHEEYRQGQPVAYRERLRGRRA